jgi:hypothetical protein
VAGWTASICLSLTLAYIMKTPQSGILPCVFVLFFCCLPNPSWASAHKAIQDSFIDGGSTTSQYGGQNWLSVENMGDEDNDLSYSKKAYIEFDISSHEQQPIHHAELQLHVFPEEGDSDYPPWTFALYGLHKSYDAWSQLALTWKNAPGNNVKSGSTFDSNSTTWLATFTMGGLGEDEDTITLAGDENSPLVQFIQAHTDTDGRVTFLIGRSTAGWSGQLATHRFASREYVPPDGLRGQDAPQLTVLPEPATISLLCLGAVAILRRSRKRSPATSRQC